MELNHNQSASALGLVVRVPDHVGSLKISKFKKHPLGLTVFSLGNKERERERESALGSEEREREREREREEYIYIYIYIYTERERDRER